MRSFLILGAAALAAASPASPAVDFDAVKAAPAPTATGPAVGVASQTGVYNAAAASASAVAAASAVASAQATASVAARGLEERTFCFWPFKCGSQASAATTSKCTTTSTPPVAHYPTATAAPTTSAATAATTSAPAPVITSASTGAVVPSTCTPVSWTNTFAFTSDTACPTPYEVGTYCGFINPEDPCAPQPDGYGPVSSPDTVDAFKANTELQQEALTAATPKGYQQTFQGLTAAVSANTYLGFYTLESYDTQTCANHCDSTDLCTGFNVYIERDPAWNPEQCSCADPTSISNYKCSLWGSGVDSAAATNTGDYRGSFQVVITGSNGYTQSTTSSSGTSPVATTPDVPSGWTNPKSCSGAVHDHPKTCLGSQVFKGPFDVSLCAKYADAQNAKNVASGKWGSSFTSFWNFFGYNSGKCDFFNAFMIKQDGVPVGTYCKLFTQQYQPAAATYKGGVSAGFSWSFESSWSFCSSK
ncbi:Uu.00g040060.m01.CDS01 [Anthostomella pinea]|uniref:Uu.00g040060.m01.CDS01 n=1 Tax=Anthostomella pinea TaxID=933095 RepID=A0AAI8YE13_9PEZI|nr:Uu.00g040060.m01.CDS01 [Anthostomella pinea]